MIDRKIVPHLLDMDTDNGAEADPSNINSLIKILHGYGFWGTNDPSNDVGVGANEKYIFMIDGQPEELEAVNQMLRRPKMRYILLNLRVTSYEDRIEKGTTQGHFAPLVRFGEFWLLLGGEKECHVCKIMHGDIADYLLTEVGRSRLLEKCQVPFGEEKVVHFQSETDKPHQSKAVAFMPVNVLKEPVSHDHLTDDEIKRITPWDHVTSTKESFDKVSF